MISMLLVWLANKISTTTNKRQSYMKNITITRNTHKRVLIVMVAMQVPGCPGAGLTGESATVVLAHLCIGF